MIAWTNAVGDVTSYTYDPQGRLIRIHTPAGLITTNIYFASGEYSNWVQTRIDLEIHRTNSYLYSNNLVYIHTNELGLITTNLYDNLQRLTNMTDSRGAISYYYNNLDLAQIVDRMGYTNSFGYDAERRLTAKTNALGNYTLYNYCSCGSLESVRDALGNFTYFYYNNAGWLTNITYPDFTIITKNYDLMGELTNTIDNAGHSVTNWFDNQGLRYASSNYFGQLSLVNFDIESLPTNTVDANGVSITNAYDFLKRITSRTHPDGGTELFSYSAFGLVAYTNQLNYGTYYGYDAALRKISEWNANFELSHYSYDPAGNLLTIIDGKNHVTSWNYDIYGLVSNKVDATSTVILVYAYDADNRLTNRWSAAKGNTHYLYDAVGNLTNIIYPVSPSISLAYDAMNRPTNMIDAVGTTRYTYDGVGQLLSEDGPWANDAVNYTYNARLRTSMSLQQPNADSWTQTYGYDEANRLTSTVSPAGTFAYSYDSAAQMQVARLALPNGAYITNTYDNVARMLSTSLKNSSGTDLDSYTYGYNVGNQRTNVIRTGGDYVDYGYDPIGQLTNATGKEAGGTSRLQEQFAYAYDTAHNLSVRTNNGLIQDFNVNSLNELTTVARTSDSTLTVSGSAAPRTSSESVSGVTVNGLTASLYGDNTFAKDGFTPTNGDNSYIAVAHDGLGRYNTNAVTAYLPATNSYTYDSNGNLLSDGNRNFAYDDENELTNVWVTNAWMSQFVYDGKLRRRITKEFTWQGGAWLQTNETRYVYDRDLVIQERNSLNLPTFSYTRGKDLSGSFQGAGGIGGLLALSQMVSIKPQHYYYHCDGCGNVTTLINSQQAIAADYLYDAYGNLISFNGPIAAANLYRFSSKEFHNNSRTTYYLYRYYDSTIQRWLNRDPLCDITPVLVLQDAPRSLIWSAAKRPLLEEREGPNIYQFVENNPLTYLDPFGRDHYQEPPFTVPYQDWGKVGMDWGWFYGQCFQTMGLSKGKACRAGCAAAAAAAVAMCGTEGPGAVVCIAAAAAAGSLCMDDCPP